MRFPKNVVIFVLIICVMFLMQGSTYGLEAHEELQNKSAGKVSPMFGRSYSAILSSLNSKKTKFMEIHVPINQLVPSGPNGIYIYI